MGLVVQDVEDKPTDFSWTCVYMLAYIIEGDIIRECDLMTKGVERWLIRTH